MIDERSRSFIMLDELRETVAASRLPSRLAIALHSTRQSASKEKGGTHTQGIAADIAVSDGVQRMTIVKEALEMGFGGIGVARTFVHVDMRATTPVMWTYG